MKWIYIVSWMIATTTQDTSLMVKSVDEFGITRMHLPREYGDYCTVTGYSERKYKRFVRRDSAIAFANRAINTDESYLIAVVGQWPVEVRLDSVKQHAGRNR